eukprot:3751584-Rhodomonas_salina.1
MLCASAQASLGREGEEVVLDINVVGKGKSYCDVQVQTRNLNTAYYDQMRNQNTACQDHMRNQNTAYYSYYCSLARATATSRSRCET